MARGLQQGDPFGAMPVVLLDGHTDPDLLRPDPDHELLHLMSLTPEMSLAILGVERKAGKVAISVIGNLRDLPNE